MEDLVADGRPSFSTADLAEVLYWLDEAARESSVRALRSSGWLEFQPETGTTITTAGRWTYDVLGFLHKNLQDTELHPTVAGVEYALEIGVDPLH